MKNQCYEFIKNDIGGMNVVGFGSYGSVRIARNIDTGDIVAVKQIYGQEARRQIIIHQSLIHPNIIKLLNYYYQKDRNFTYMVLEYAQNGSLNEKIKFGLGQLSKEFIRRYFRDVCQAIQYMHSNNYMHRDIKPENILITRDNIAKLCDFGFATIFDSPTTVCGTFQYMAPEMIKKKQYNYKIDIWALGILLFQMIQGLAPFRGNTGQEVLAEMKKPIKFSQRFDSLEIDLIKKILRVNADNRPPVEEILQHAYFKQTKDDQQINKRFVPYNSSQFVPYVRKIQQKTSIQQKLNQSNEQLSQSKNEESQFNPIKRPQIPKPKGSFLYTYEVIKTESVTPNFIQLNQLNRSFKTKDPFLSTKAQYSVNSKTCVPNQKVSEKKNWISKVNFTRIQEINQKNKQKFNKSKKSGGNNFNYFMNKSFRDFKGNDSKKYVQTQTFTQSSNPFQTIQNFREFNIAIGIKSPQLLKTSILKQTLK